MDIPSIVSEALAVLKRGGLIVYPTDTIWGIGCDATNEAAVQKVFALKHRSGAKSLVLLASDLDMVARYVKKIPPIAIDLVEVNDAPMTVVYPGAVTGPYGLAPSTVAEDASVGIRIPRIAPSPDNEAVSAGAVFCNKLIFKLRAPLVSTSANISGEPSPENFRQISKEILCGVDYVVPNSFLDERGRNVRFDDSASGRSSQIIKLGLGGEVEVIRP